MTYTDTFRQRQGPLLLVLLALNIPIMIAVIVIVIVIVSGRWSARSRRIQSALSLVLCAAMAWTVLDGPVFVGSGGDEAVKSYLLLIIIITLVCMAITWRRGIKPAPN